MPPTTFLGRLSPVALLPILLFGCTESGQEPSDSGTGQMDPSHYSTTETGAVDATPGEHVTADTSIRDAGTDDAAAGGEGSTPSGSDTGVSPLSDASLDPFAGDAATDPSAGDANTAPPASGTSAHKTGVLFLHVGSDDQYKFDWHIQFMNNLYDLFPPGQYAGGGLEGSDCFTLVHYADQAEAAICGVAEGTPIDVFCNTHTLSDAYPIHSLGDHPALGDSSFANSCYAEDLFHPLMMLWFGHTTVDPNTGEEIPGPHIDDPDGVGIGIADFLEMSGFVWMHNLYLLPNHRDTHRLGALKWWYGNDAAGLEPDAEELTNIKDKLIELKPGHSFAFRHGWEAYMENTDVYGNPLHIPDSTETAIRELAEDEEVDRIVVLHSYPSFANLTQFGHEWYDEEGSGVSAVPGKTFKECVEDLDDGVGPATQADLDLYLTNKPWDSHDTHPFPLIKRLVEEISPSTELLFAPGYGEFDGFAQATLEALQYAVDKFEIPRDASLQVILVHHGFYSAYMDAQACDCYTQRANDLFDRTSAKIRADFFWDGRMEVTNAAGEFAEGEYGMADVPSAEKPQGDVISLGEQIDNSINGQWVNSQGELVDNGEDNFQYIVVLPYYFDTESSDTIFEKRKPLGNYISDDLGAFVRDERDQDGTEYNEGDLDEENFTVKVFDASGWTSVPAGQTESVNKGSASHPTAVIVTGTVLSLGNGPARTHLTEAAARAVLSVIE